VGLEVHHAQPLVTADHRPKPVAAARLNRQAVAQGDAKLLGCRFMPNMKLLSHAPTHHAATARAPPPPVAVCLGVVGPEKAFIAPERLPSASIDIGGLTLIDIERDLRCDPTGISRASLAGWPRKHVVNGLAQRDPTLDPVDLGWHLCHFARAKWQSYMSAYRCPQAHLMVPHATFASCVLCSQPSMNIKKPDRP